MKKLLFSLAILAFVFLISVGTALAGGDKVHGDKAAGDPSQYCVSPGDCTWE